MKLFGKRKKPKERIAAVRPAETGSSKKCKHCGNIRAAHMQFPDHCPPGSGSGVFPGTRFEVEQKGEPVRFEYIDIRRPTPDIAVRYRHIELGKDGKPKNGSLFTLEEFEGMVLDGGFIDYDGTGYYASATMGAQGLSILESNQNARPSAIHEGIVDRYWPHVMWYNR